MREPTQWELDVAWLAEQPQGRRILIGILTGTGVLAPPASTGNLYQLGRESVGHEFFGPLAFHFPALLVSLLTEIQTASNDRARKRNDSGTDRADD